MALVDPLRTSGSSKAPDFDSNCFSTSARVVPAFKDGRSQGLKVFGIRPGSVFAVIGLKALDGGTLTLTDGGTFRRFAVPRPAVALQVWDPA